MDPQTGNKLRNSEQWQKSLVRGRGLKKYSCSTNAHLKLQFIPSKMNSSYLSM